jgi:hypothetical protein
MKKPLPPYGNFLDTSKIYTSAFIFAGPDAWQQAKYHQDNFPNIMLLPQKASPSKYRWPVENRNVYLCDTGESDMEFVKFFAFILFNHGANIVIYYSPLLNFDIEKGI